MEEELELGSFIFSSILFTCCIVQEDELLKIPFEVQFDELILFYVNGTFIPPYEVEDWLAAQREELKEDLFLNLQNFAENAETK